MASLGTSLCGPLTVTMAGSSSRSSSLPCQSRGSFAPRAFPTRTTVVSHIACDVPHDLGISRGLLLARKRVDLRKKLSVSFPRTSLSGSTVVNNGCESYRKYYPAAVRKNSFLAKASLFHSRSTNHAAAISMPGRRHNPSRRDSRLITCASSVAPAVVDPPGNYSQAFIALRLVQFVSILLGYSCYYITRNCLQYTGPVMVATPDLGVTMTTIGVITSIFPIFYGFSKFVSGVVSTKVSAQFMLGGGLMLTGIICTVFSYSSSLAVFSILWAMMGILQGFGAPSCAKILTWWFATFERGTFWGMWNIAHNLGGFLAPIIAGTLASAFGWQWGIRGPGLLGIFVGMYLVLVIRDKPQDAGFPAVEPV